jgi:hypothetical protein
VVLGWKVQEESVMQVVKVGESVRCISIARWPSWRGQTRGRHRRRSQPARVLACCSGSG